MSMSLMEMVASARGEVREIPPTEASAALDRGEIKLVLDVRERNEFDRAHLPGAVNLPRGMLELRADPASPVTLPALSDDLSGRVLVYCTKAPSARSVLAAQTLASMGYENVEALEGGLEAWAAAQLATE